MLQWFNRKLRSGKGRDDGEGKGTARAKTPARRAAFGRTAIRQAAGAACELLEGRQLLSLTFAASGNTLIVNGDGTNQLIEYAQSGVDVVVEENNAVQYFFTNVTALVVNAGAGDDTVGSAGNEATFPVTLSGDAGDDWRRMVTD